MVPVHLASSGSSNSGSRTATIAGNPPTLTVTVECSQPRGRLRPVTNNRAQEAPRPGSGPDPDPAASVAATRLRAFGYAVERVTPAGEPACDLRATLDEESLLVEVKSAHLDSKALGRLRRGEQIPVERDIARSRDRSRRYDRAAGQLASTAGTDLDPLRLVWVRCRGPGEIALSLESFCTLYGIRWYHLTAWKNPMLVNVVPVYLADRAWFRSNPDICAVVEEGPNGLSLRVNPFALYRDRLERTRLFRTVLKLGGVFDLADVRDGPGILVVDCEGAAPTGEAVRDSLRARYGIEVRGTKVAAESTAWPRNEMGGYGHIPGWDVGVPDLRWFEWLAEQEATGARQSSDR